MCEHTIEVWMCGHTIEVWMCEYTIGAMYTLSVDQAYTHTHKMHTHTLIHTYTLIHTHKHICEQMYFIPYAFTHPHPNTRAHTHTHTHIHTHTNTHTNPHPHPRLHPRPHPHHTLPLAHTPTPTSTPTPTPTWSSACHSRSNLAKALVTLPDTTPPALLVLLPSLLAVVFSFKVVLALPLPGAELELLLLPLGWRPRAWRARSTRSSRGLLVTRPERG